MASEPGEIGAGGEEVADVGGGEGWIGRVERVVDGARKGVVVRRVDGPADVAVVDVGAFQPRGPVAAVAVVEAPGDVLALLLGRGLGGGAAQGGGGHDLHVQA